MCHFWGILPVLEAWESTVKTYFLVFMKQKPIGTRKALRRVHTTTNTHQFPFVLTRKYQPPRYAWFLKIKIHALFSDNLSNMWENELSGNVKESEKKAPGLAPNIIGLYSEPRTIFHPSLVGICLAVFVLSWSQTNKPSTWYWRKT